MGVNAGRLTRRTDIQWIDAVDHVWGGVVAWLSVWSEVHTAQLMPLPGLSLASVKSRLVLPFWYRLTRRVCVCDAVDQWCLKRILDIR